MSDNDLIRRGYALIAAWEADSLELATHGAGKIEARINAIPAVQPTVKPLRYIEPEGETLDQMRDHARQHPLAQAGDMRLVWVNEGDLHMHTIFHAAQPTVSPKAQPDDVAALVEAAAEALSEIEAGDVSLVVIRDLRAALARVKGVM